MLDGFLDRVGFCRFGWRIRCELVFLLAAPTVGAFLTVLAQIDFAILAADHRSVTLAAVSMTFFTVVAEGNMPRTYRDTLVVLKSFLTVKLQLTLNTL